MDDREDRIRARAHQIWEEQGCPEGRHEEHWRQACAEFGEEGGRTGGDQPQSQGGTGAGTGAGAEAGGLGSGATARAPR